MKGCRFGRQYRSLAARSPATTPPWCRAPSVRHARRALLTETIRTIHTASRGVYGARRVHAELTKGHGIQVWHGTVEMLMARAGLKGVGGGPKWCRARPDLISTDLVDRQFARDGVNESWD
nr:IS3 family transposase [Cellulosimicrobium sp. I38E]